MESFSKSFYASRLALWSNKYFKLIEMKQLVKMLKKDIVSNFEHDRSSFSNNSSNSIGDNRISQQLDRRSVGLSVLIDKNGILNKNDKIFNTPIMYNIDEMYTELNGLEFEDSVKIFLYYLNIEVHNIYVFYLSIEKDIFNRTNNHLHEKYRSTSINEGKIIAQLGELTEIAYLTYSFYLYSDINMEAVKQILDYFDKYFLELNHGISIKKLFFNKNLSENESDLKYILSFKIIKECTILLESYCNETLNLFHNNKKIKEQSKELNDVLSYIIERNTNRLNENLSDVYQIYGKNNILKQKKYIESDIQNSICLETDQTESLIEEAAYDKKIKIKITKRNKLNLFLVFSYIFLYSFLNVILFVILLFYYNEKKIEFYGIAPIFFSLHVGSIFSKLAFSNSDKYKILYFLFSLCFIMSSLLVIIAFKIKEDENEDENEGWFYFTIFYIMLILSRIFHGFGGGRVLTRKYLLLYLPESKIKSFSFKYILIGSLGNIFGIIFAFILFYNQINFRIWILELNKYSGPFFIALLIGFFYMILIIILFTEPDNTAKGRMLYNKVKIIKEIPKYMEYQQEEEEENKDDDKNVIKNELSNVNNSANNDESSSDEFEITVNAEKSNILNNKNGKENKKNNIKTSKEFNISKTKNSVNNNKSSKSPKEKLLNTSEIKGLNSIENAIISLNNESKFNDTNLLPKELERIKKSQFQNKTFLKTISTFIAILFFSNCIHEYIIYMIPSCILLVNENIFYHDENKEYIFLIAMIIIFISCFPFITIYKMRSKGNIGRKFYLLLYILINLCIISLIICTYYDIKIFVYLMLIGFIFLIINLIIDSTHLISKEIIPSFVKIYGFNVKYILSYINIIGKIIGGILFCVLTYFEANKKNYELKNYIKYSGITFCAISVVGLVILCLGYFSLRIRALSKLRYLEY